VNPSSSDPATDALIDEIRERVAERRQSGFYPEGLEEELDAHFQRIVSHRRGVDAERLRDSLQELDARSRFSRRRIPTDSKVAGGAVAHRAVGLAIARQTSGVLEQVQGFSDGVRATLRLIVDALESPYEHLHSDLLAQLDAVWERLAAWERGPVDSAAAVGDLRRRVEALEAAEQSRRFSPTWSADAFEARFRGTGDDLKERYRDLAERVAGYGPVLDIGCGRGEFIELLGEYGAEASGVELDATLAAEGRRRGLDIATGDGVRHLAAQEDGSLGAVVLLQVAEHLTPQQVIDLVGIALEKVRAGGLLLIETVNPQSLYTFAHAFYLDPTHTNPIHPAYLEFVVRQSGWPQVAIEWRSPPEAHEQLETEPGASATAAANIDRLNRLLFAPQDYALVAFK
jgi:SAM-dependent methyltransferase